MPRIALLTFAGALAVAGSLIAASPARAGAPLLVMLEPDRRDAIAPALALELASRDVELLIVDAPEGATSLARAAAAQEACRFVGGVAAVFVEGQTVRLVGAGADTVRHAPLPSPYESIEPRIFAVVAHSLLAELVGPPDAPIRVTVAIDAPGREVTLARVVPGHDGGATAEVHVEHSPRELTAPAAPPTTTEGDVDARPLVGFERWPLRAGAAASDALPLADGDVDDTPLLPREGLFVEGSVLFAGIALGGGLGLGWQLEESLRLSLALNAVAILVDGSGAYMPQLTLARVGGSRNGRFDFGAQAGVVIVDEPTDDYPPTVCEPSGSCSTGGTSYQQFLRVGWAAGGFFGWTWEVDDWVGIGLRLSVQVASIDGRGPILAPMLTAHTELPI